MTYCAPVSGPVLVLRDLGLLELTVPSRKEMFTKQASISWCHCLQPLSTLRQPSVYKLEPTVPQRALSLLLTAVVLFILAPH